MKVYYWSPFISYVATTSAVINSIKSIKKFSNGNIKCKIINVFNEWDDYNDKSTNNNLDLIELNTKLNIKNLPKGSFVKSRLAYLITYFFSIFNLHFLLKKDKPEYLILHLITSIPLTLLTIFNYQTKFILRISGYPKLNILRSILWKLSAKKIDKVFCPTHLTKEMLIKNKIFNSNKIFVVKDPIINVKKIAQNKKKLIEKNDEWIKEKKYIISIGRLTKQKNFSFLIENFENISKEFKDLHLIILGEGEEKKKLKQLIIKKNLEKKILLIGNKKNIYPYLVNSLFFILTSNWEDPGFVILEAMFARKLVFSSDCYNGPREIIDHGFNGFLYKNNNKSDFEKKFLEIIKIIQRDDIDKKNILRFAIKKTKLYSLFDHYKDIIKHLN